MAGAAETVKEALGLPDKLVVSGGSEKPTTDVLAGKDYVMLYFSASWCGPCHAFTPELVKFYNKHSAEKKFEVIFVSSDRDAGSFKEYHGKMPWSALPFSEAGTKAKLSSKFGVQGIPTLVVVDAATGETVTTKAREGVMSDSGAAKFPWKPRSAMEVLSGAAESGILKRTDGSVVSAADLGKLDAVGLLFSASWCPPCRAFEPVLREWYGKNKDKHNLDIVFVSSDRDEAAHNEYRKEMPWLALDFSARALKAELSQIFDVEGIPTFLFINQDGKVTVSDARTMVSSDPDNYPWPPKAVEEPEVALGSINDEATFILFTDTLTAPQDEAVEAFRQVANEFFEKRKAGDKGPVFTILGTEHETTPRIRGFIGLSGDADGDKAIRPVLLNIPVGKKYLMADKPALFTKDELRTWAQEALDGKAAAKGIRD